MADTKGSDPEEESEYSYVYETDSEYEYYTESEAEEEQAPVQGTVTVPPAVTLTQSNDDRDNNDEVADNLEEEEDENEALKRHKQQLERFKPKVPAYVTDPEPCAFSDDPSTWIAWMEDQVNREKTRRMEIIMQEQEEEEEVREPSPEVTTAYPSNENEHIVEPEPAVVIVEETGAADKGDGEEDSEWEWEYEDEEGEEVEVSMSLNLNSKSEDVAGNNLEADTPAVTSDEHVEGEEKMIDNAGQEQPSEEIKDAETVENNVRCVYDKQMSLPAENSKRRELVPKEMQEKINFIRRKKAEAAAGKVGGQSPSSCNGENPTAQDSSDLVEETKRKLAFIKDHKKTLSDLDLESCPDNSNHDPNDPLDAETRRKLEFVRKNKKRSAPDNGSEGISSSPPALARQQSNPEGSKAAGRPNSFAEQYGDDSNLNDMLARIKTLRAERKQILQDMNAIKSAFGGPSASGSSAGLGTAESAEVDRMEAADDGIETGESTPCNEISSPFKDDNHLTGVRRRSIDSGIGAKSSSSIQGGSPTDELDSISESCPLGSSDNPARKKISKEEKEHEEGVFYCFICGENLGKMSKGTVMHMGLEDGEPVCPDALYLTDESKEKIMSIASTRMFTYEAKYELLDTMELETWDLEYDIPTGDLMDKVDAFLQDVELQKQRDKEKFEAMRSGAIDEIFMEEFKDLLSEKCLKALSCNNTEASDVVDNNNATCDSKASELSDPVMAPAPPPPPPSIPTAPQPPTPTSAASIPPAPPAFNNVLKSIREGDTPKLKPTEVSNHSEIEVGQVIHKHIAPRVFTKDVRNLVKDISKDDHKRRLKKVKTNDKSAPFIPDDVEIYFYGGHNANKAAPPPPLSKIKEEFNSSKKR